MLTDEEKKALKLHVRMCRTGSDSFAEPIVAIIERLQTPRAVLDAAEAMLRGKSITGVVLYPDETEVERPVSDGSSDMSETLYTSRSGKCLAGAWEALKGGA